MMQETLHLALQHQRFKLSVTCHVHVLHRAMSGAVRVTFTTMSAVRHEHVSSSDKL